MSRPPGDAQLLHASVVPSCHIRSMMKTSGVREQRVSGWRWRGQRQWEGTEQDAARWRGWGATTLSLPPWAHQRALNHRWRRGGEIKKEAERSSQTRSQQCEQLRVERRAEKERGDIKEKPEASKSTLLRRIWGVCVYNPTSEAECEST